MVNEINDKKQRLNYFKELYHRNKFLLKFSAVIFIVLFIVGLILGYYQAAYIENLLNTYIKMLKSANIQINTSYIFLHNFQAAFLSYMGGIVLGIIPFLILSFNSFIYGAFLGYLFHGSVAGTSLVLTPGYFLAYSLPHGVFEFPGFIVAAAAGFRLTTLVYGIVYDKIKKNPVNVHFWKFKDSLVLFGISTLLIFIAAIIEANFTMSIGNLFTGLNIQ